MNGSVVPADARAREAAVLRLLPRSGDAFFGRFGRLLPVQMAAIPTLLSGEDAIVCAPTAGGKTEAVAAPLAERSLAAGPSTGLSLLYVTPTRALVNDLVRRLSGPLGRLGIDLAAKTSDHPLKSTERLTPWLITTPESFDSLLVRRPSDLLGVTAVVLDEIHLLDGAPRGDQLRVLMARLRRLHQTARARGARSPEARLQTVLLSATVADPEATAANYSPSAVAIRVEGRRSIVTLGTRLASSGSLARALSAIPRLEAAKVLVFTRSRADCEEVAAALAGQPPYGANVFAHHGSLSTRTRLAAERAFHSAASAVFVATSTLELGIDIGGIDWIVQFGPPASVGSFLQQIGRGCRRRKDVTKVLAIARGEADEVVFEVLLDLARASRIEAPGRIFAASVLVQQIASYLLQRSSGTIGRSDIEALLGGGAAANLDAILASMSSAGLLEPARGGRYSAGPVLESWLEREPRRLHTNIGSPKGTVALFDAETHQEIGRAERTGIPAAGRVAFGGRSTVIERSEGDKLYLRRGKGNGDGAKSPSYWTPRAPMSLALAQAIRERLGVPSETVATLELEREVILFPFLGGCGTRALASHLTLSGAKVRRVNDVAIALAALPPLQSCRLDPERLARAVEAGWKQIERFQEPGAHVKLVPDDVRRMQVLARLVGEGILDVAGWEDLRPISTGAADALWPFRA